MKWWGVGVEGTTGGGGRVFHSPGDVGGEGLEKPGSATWIDEIGIQ